MTPQRTLALCADDFGLSPAVCLGILDLVRRERLGAVSCLVNAPAWPAFAQELARLPAVAGGRVQLGLHFNLTEGRPLSSSLAERWPSLPALPRLIAQAHLRRLPLAAIADELQAQHAAFVRGAGCAPAFVDGHQHVHHLPGVRDGLLQWLAQARAPAPAVRATGHLPGPGFGFKRALIAGTGGRALARALDRRGLRHNASLFGVYDFKAPDYRALMRGWLAALPPSGALLFCHPARAAADDGDAIAAARARELAYLGSDAFGADLDAAGVRLAPAW